MKFHSAVEHALRSGCTIDCGPEPDPEAGTRRYFWGDDRGNPL